MMRSGLNAFFSQESLWPSEWSKGLTAFYLGDTFYHLRADGIIFSVSKNNAKSISGVSLPEEFLSMLLQA
jgi:hypothetical protein